KARQIGGQRVDEILFLGSACAALKIVDIGVKAGQAERAHDLGEPRNHEGPLGIAQSDPRDPMDPFLDPRKLALAEGILSLFHIFFPEAPGLMALSGPCPANHLRLARSEI